MPVYNGENFLREAIVSLLKQTFTDFELIISDNASTDATESICREFAAQDSRIRYYRAEQNHGASWNHDFVIRHATAPFFKLAAHDDVCLPIHLQACMSALEQFPQSPLAYTLTTMIFDDEPRRRQVYRDGVQLQSPIAALRFGDLITEAPPAFPVFGVIRREALDAIPQFEPYKASDRVVLARLALLGPFALVREPLFVYRWHASNASNLMASGKKFYQWWNSGERKIKKVYPETRLAWEFLRSAWIVPLSLAERRQVWREAWHWTRNNWPRLRKGWLQLLGAELPDYPPATPAMRMEKRQRRAEFKKKHYAKP